MKNRSQMIYLVIGEILKVQSMSRVYDNFNLFAVHLGKHIVLCIPYIVLLCNIEVRASGLSAQAVLFFLISKSAKK